MCLALLSQAPSCVNAAQPGLTSFNLGNPHTTFFYPKAEEYDEKMLRETVDSRSCATFFCHSAMSLPAFLLRKVCNRQKRTIAKREPDLLIMSKVTNLLGRYKVLFAISHKYYTLQEF